MSKLPEYYDVGDRRDMDIERLLLVIEDIYKQLATALNQKPDVFQRTTDGLTTDTFLSNGDMNINTNTLKVEMLTKHSTVSTVVWTTLS
jgi:hypothetical protein